MTTESDSPPVCEMMMITSRDAGWQEPCGKPAAFLRAADRFFICADCYADQADEPQQQAEYAPIVAAKPSLQEDVQNLLVAALNSCGNGEVDLRAALTECALRVGKALDAGKRPQPMPPRRDASTLESAEAFARRLGGPEYEWSITPAIAAIEADRNATRLELLNELLKLQESGCTLFPSSWLREQLAKHVPPRELGDG